MLLPVLAVKKAFGTNVMISSVPASKGIAVPVEVTTADAALAAAAVVPIPRNATTEPAFRIVSTTLGGNQYRILNAGAVTAFLGVGTTAAAANSAAAVVTSSGEAIPLLAGTDEIITFLPNAYFTAVTGSSNAVIYITPGDGN